MSEKRIVVVGAGVAGLTTAMLLSHDPANTITIAAKFMPGDYDIEYASPWAGANYMPVSKQGTPAAEWDLKTWGPLQDLATDHPEAGIHFQNTTIYNRKQDENSMLSGWNGQLHNTNPWWKSSIPNFRVLSPDELPSGADSGTMFTSVCINTAIYLPWLVSQCLKAGVIFKRAVFKHISEAASAHHSGQKADLVVNCTGLSASKLGGVEDKTVIPARGQILVVRNDPGVMCAISGCDDGEEECTYIMTRAAGGGTILGGCYQKGKWESQPDPNLAVRIMKRCVALCPALTGGKGIEHLDIVRQGVGLRPLRFDGARIEKEKIGEVWVVHNYGHGGYGYQSSYGCAESVMKLATEIFGGQGKPAPQSKL